MDIPNKIQNILKDKLCIQDTIGKSGAGVYIYEDMVLKIQKADAEAENEVKMLHWLQDKLPVPRIIEHIHENEFSYILMNKCTGKMACEPYYMKQPKHQVELLSQALHSLWEVPIEDCPSDFTLKKRLAMAEERVIYGRVDIADAEPETFGPNGFRDPEALLCWLLENQPSEQQMLCHGDFCLPNIFLSENGVTGMIDVGRSGIGDPWQDIALCYRSLKNNYSGYYDGISYVGYDPEMLFDALGMLPDPDRIRYYILLDELF